MLPCSLHRCGGVASSPCDSCSSTWWLSASKFAAAVLPWDGQTVVLFGELVAGCFPACVAVSAARMGGRQQPPVGT
jgi:hypothetical protein